MHIRPCEPRLADALADPVILAVMAADGIDPQAFETSLREQARRLDGRLPRRNAEREAAPCRW